ncbi:zf-HC2 domain-containing protein [Chitinimonas arctica]|uniref:Zf-HC2 domain-containing protein n=1 Tax=Chitinimonas arctica TaxID=2594795 RepID=A0A516SE63_9NEIS|nr:zf-HC2 domain-containing protein [Chitinimonas arctica]QDQ26454.1 zf-HC2 domain-containing protein [Chitinimonas arctica]
MKCKEATHLVSAGMDRPLNWRERLGLRWHLLVCHYCSDFSRQLGFLRKVARDKKDH